jgi:Asp-tRNA(Asn)/Glu-tRNA(Gln) amidotransferase B subunit
LRRWRKGRELEEGPTHILNNFKKVEDRSISEKDRKKVEEMAKKNGLDPAFMAETFGVEKNHNAELLNAIIDKHNHVDR